MIVLNNIDIEFNRPLIKKSSMIILDGKITSIIGESGCGKSSLLYLVGLISANHNYTYSFDGQSLNLGDDKETSLLRKKKIGYIFQENSLIENLTIQENFKTITSLAGIRITNEEIYEYLKYVQLDISSKCYPRQLSSGERQRVAIACVLSKQPDLIIADEPTSTLDCMNSDLIMKTFKKIAYENNKKIIIATHNEKVFKQTDIIYEISNQTIMLQKGTIK